MTPPRSDAQSFSPDARLLAIESPMSATRSGRDPLPSHVGGASAADGPCASSSGVSAWCGFVTALFPGVALSTTRDGTFPDFVAVAVSGGGGGGVVEPDNKSADPVDAVMVTSAST